MTALFNPVKTFPGTSEVISCISYEMSDKYLVKLTVAAPYKNTYIQGLIEDANFEGVYFSMKCTELLSYSAYVSFVHFKADKEGFVKVIRFLQNSGLISRRDLSSLTADLGMPVNLSDSDTELDIDTDTDSDEMDIPSRRFGLGI